MYSPTGYSQPIPSTPQAYQNVTNQVQQVAKPPPVPQPTPQTQQPVQAVNNPTNPNQDLTDYVSNLQKQLIDQINGQANDQLNALPGQRDYQTGVVESNYQQGLSDLNTSNQTNLNNLELQGKQNAQNKVKSLNDLTENMTNVLKAGNTYLGARGAADSSANNQYSYAVTKMANKNRANIEQQYSVFENELATRKQNLGLVYQNELTRLDKERANQLSAISQWFTSAQREIQSVKGQNLNALTNQTLQYGLNLLSQAKQNYENRVSALQSWALKTASSWDQAVKALGLEGSFKVGGIQNPSLNAMPTVTDTNNFSVNSMLGYGANKEKVWNPITQKWE